MSKLENNKNADIIGMSVCTAKYFKQQISNINKKKSASININHQCKLILN